MTATPPPLPLPPPPMRSLWVDQAPAVVCTPAWLDEVVGLGVRSLAVMVSAPAQTWQPTWPEGRIAWLAAECICRDWELVLTTWPGAGESAIDQMSDALGRYCSYGASGVEVDIEHLWRPARLGAARYTDLARRLVARLVALRDAHDVRLELTTHTGHRELTEAAAISPVMGRIVVQAYSVSNDQAGRTYHWTDPARGPGLAQDRALRLARRVPGVAEGTVQLSCGLAAWAQGWPGHTVAQAMEVAYQAALAWRPHQVRWWSSKWVTGSRARSAPARWLRG